MGTLGVRGACGRGTIGGRIGGRIGCGREIRRVDGCLEVPRCAQTDIQLSAIVLLEQTRGKKTDHELRFLPLLAAMEPATPAAMTASTDTRHKMTLQTTMSREDTAVFLGFDGWVLRYFSCCSAPSGFCP